MHRGQAAEKDLHLAPSGHAAVRMPGQMYQADLSRLMPEYFWSPHERDGQTAMPRLDGALDLEAAEVRAKADAELGEAFLVGMRAADVVDADRAYLFSLFSKYFWFHHVHHFLLADNILLFQDRKLLGNIVF